MRSTFASLAFLVCTALALPAIAQPRTFGGGGANFGANTTTVTTISGLRSAIAAASAGDVILVAPGTYDTAGTTLSIPATGISLVGMDPERCKIINSVDETRTITIAGNVRIANLDISSYAATTHAGGDSTAIYCNNAATPIVIEGNRISGGTDGIYSTSAMTVGASSPLCLIRNNHFPRPYYDLIFLQWAAGHVPMVVVDGNTAQGSGGGAATGNFTNFARFNIQAGKAYITNNKVEISTPQAVESHFLDITATASGGWYYVSGNSATITSTDGGDVYGVNVGYSSSTTTIVMRNNSWGFTSTGDTADFVGNQGTNAAGFNGTLDFDNATTLTFLSGLITTNSRVYLPNVPDGITCRNPRGFTVAARTFANLNWTNATTKLTGASLQYPFRGYTLHANDPIVVTDTGGDADLTAGAGTITAKGTNGIDLTVSGLVSSGDVSAGVDGYINSRAVHCGLGDVATMTIDADLPVHIEGTQRAGQKMTLVMLASGSRTVTLGGGIKPGSGGATQALTDTKKTIIHLVSDGTSFLEQSRTVDLTP